LRPVDDDCSARLAELHCELGHRTHGLPKERGLRLQAAC
jgi:hypothetical protein